MHVVTVTIKSDDSVDVMHNILGIKALDLIVKVVDQRNETVDSAIDISFISEKEQMELVAQHLANGYEDRAL